LRDFVERLDAGVSVNSENTQVRNGEARVLKISCVSGGVFDPNDSKAILLHEVNQARVNPIRGRIVISRSNTRALVGASAYFPEDYPNLYLPDSLWQTVYSKGIKISPSW
jgi:type I restriction enzyme S subunit